MLKNRLLQLHPCQCEPEPEDFPSISITTALHPQHRSLGYLLPGLDAATVDTIWEKYPIYSMNLLTSPVPFYRLSVCFGASVACTTVRPSVQSNADLPIYPEMTFRGGEKKKKKKRDPGLEICLQDFHRSPICDSTRSISSSHHPC